MLSEVYVFLTRFPHHIWRWFCPKYPQQELKPELLEYRSPVPPHSFGKEVRTICSEIGVGVYQGEARVFHPQRDKIPHGYWVSNILRYCDLPHIHKVAVQQLHCLACQLENSLQFCLLQQDSQNILAVEPKSECHQETYVPEALLPSSVDGRNNDAIPNKLKLQQEETLKCPKCQQCPYINSKQNTGVNTNATKPSFTS